MPLNIMCLRDGFLQRGGIMKHTHSSSLLFGLVIFVSGMPAGAQTAVLNELHKIVPADGAASDRFGGSVAVDGGLTLIGASFDDDNSGDSGSVYLYDADTGTLISKILATDPTRETFGHFEDLFGDSVGLIGNTAVIGAVNSSEAGTFAGAVYVLDLATGQQRAKLLPFTFPGEFPSFQSFGFDVGLSNTHIAVGAPGDVERDSGAGAMYLYNAASLGLVAKVFASDADFADNFGRAVAISGATAVATSPFDDDLGEDSGSAYVFDASTGVQLLKLLPADGAQSDIFGLSVAINGNVVAVGAPYHDALGTDSGAVYLFDAISGAQLAKVVPEDGAAGDLFGFSVALDGTRLVVGAPLDDDSALDAGSAYVFDVPAGTPLAKLRASDANVQDALGTRVAISGNLIVAGVSNDDDLGAESGSAYIFQIDDAPGGGEATRLHVASIEPGTVPAGRNRLRAQVFVRIQDDLNNPVAGAVVTVALSGGIRETLSGTTGADGAVTLTSVRVRRSPLSYTACITRVEGPLSYDPDANVEHCDSN
jgi:hypothetical protein